MNKKKHKPEDMKRFIYAFAQMFAKDAVPVLIVDVTRTKNRFYLGIKTKDDVVYMLDNGYEFIGTIGKFNTLFEKANPRIMLRRQVMLVEDLFNVFGLDENAVYETLFKKIKDSVSNAISKGYDSNGKMHFGCYYDHCCNATSRLSAEAFDQVIDDLGPTPDVSSIDELMVLADMHAGV